MENINPMSRNQIYWNHTLIYCLLLILCCIGFAFQSCQTEEDKNNNQKNTLHWKDNRFKVDSCFQYISAWGTHFRISGHEIEVFIILSENKDQKFDFQYLVNTTDSNKAAIAIKYRDSIYYSLVGEISLNNHTGIFKVRLNDNSTMEGSFSASAILRGPYLNFQDISMTDAQGVPVSAPDTTDWNMTTNFILPERLLMYEFDHFQSNKDIDISFYPNPVQKQATLRLEQVDDGFIQMKLINDNFELIHAYQYGLSSSVLSLNLRFDDLGLAGSYCRLLFCIETKDTKIHYCGKGDLKITP